MSALLAKLLDAAVLAEAVATSILCTCETSGNVSPNEVHECAECGICVCSGCAQWLDCTQHVLQRRCSHQQRSSPLAFQQKLRSLMWTSRQRARLRSSASFD